LGFPGVSAYGHLKAEVTVTAVRAEAVGSASAWVLPWGLIVIFVVALILVGMLLWRRRRRRRLTSALRVDNSSDANPSVSNAGSLVGAAGDQHVATSEADDEPLHTDDRG